ncbi:phosphotransferase [Actinocorallia sp. A-T 12471]|uniref:phosphotransferase n=1 Tax=Actinocorallia sp. A-T 12471 TaxID=3089813 RepID=UPI0039B6EB31
MWTPEREIGVEQVRRLLRGRFPEVEARSVEFLNAGWDNAVFLVDGVWAFRFPHRKIALDLLRKEMTVLPALAGKLPLPIPSPRFVGEDDGDPPWPFVGGPFLPGRELALANLSPEARIRAAEALGGFLAVLHSLTPPPGLPHDPMLRADPVARARMARETLADLERRGLHTPDPDVTALLDSAHDPGPQTRVLVHGDLHLRHLLVTDDGAPTGVIDWGDTCTADPSVDLSFAYAAFEGPSRAAFFTAYGPPTPAQDHRARILALSLTTMLIASAPTPAHRKEPQAALPRTARLPPPFSRKPPQLPHQPPMLPPSRRIPLNLRKHSIRRPNSRNNRVNQHPNPPLRISELRTSLLRTEHPPPVQKRIQRRNPPLPLPFLHNLQEHPHSRHRRTAQRPRMVITHCMPQRHNRPLHLPRTPRLPQPPHHPHNLLPPTPPNPTPPPTPKHPEPLPSSTSSPPAVTCTRSVVGSGPSPRTGQSPSAPATGIPHGHAQP